MRWLELVARDPVPWLLDPSNPSARFLTLRDIFQKPLADIASEQQRILDWAPIVRLRTQWDPINLWGRADSPYFGGALGNFGTLYLLTQLGAPAFQEAILTCKNLLTKGQRSDGHFAPEGSTAMPPICYTGMALQIFRHFGYDDTPQVQSAQQLMIETVLEGPDRLGHATADRSTQVAAVKVLGALCQLRPSPFPPHNDTERAIAILVHYLLSYDYDWRNRDAGWLALRFPRYYDTDIVELGHIIANTDQHAHPGFKEILKRMIALQNPEGRWIKTRSTMALSWEHPMHPSRWLTLEAIHTLILAYGDQRYAP